MDSLHHLDQKLERHDAAEVRLIHTMLAREGFWLDDGAWNRFVGGSWMEIVMKFRTREGEFPSSVGEFPPVIEEIMGKFGYRRRQHGTMSVSYCRYPPYTIAKGDHFQLFWCFMGTPDPPRPRT